MNRTRIRICRVIARLNVGGPAVHVIQLTSGLDTERFEQLVVTGLEGPQEASMLAQARASGVEPIVLPEMGRELNVRDDAVALLKLIRIFRAWQPHIVETHTAKAGTLGRIAALMAGVPVTVHVFHGHVFSGYFSPSKTRVFLEIERALARWTTRIVALGEVQRKELLAYGVGRPDTVVPIPLGFNLQSFLSASPTGAMRRRIGCDASAPLIGIVARLVPIKRIDIFLEMAARVLVVSPQSQFVVIGDGELRQRLKAQAQAIPLAEHVHFLGWQPPEALPHLYADLDLVVLTSDNEGMPVSLIEAMAAGKPAVATDVGGVRSVVEHGVTGLLAPKGDVGALANACIQLVQDDRLRSRMGVAARAAAFPRFGVETLLSRMTHFYTTLAKGQP